MMLPAKIKGLNQDTSDESGDEEESPVTKEALEQKTQQGYRDALILQKQNKLFEAEGLLKELLQSDVLLQAAGKVQYTNGKLQPSIFHLKYCCYLNLGNILFTRKDFKSALDYYLKATELDDTDLNLWYKIGNVAMKIPNLMFAISAFMETLARNPHHWPSLDSIISATYAIGDYMAALLYVSQALKLDPQYIKGIILKDRILNTHPEWTKDFKLFYPEYDLSVNSEFDKMEADKLFQSIDRLKSKDPALSVTLFSVNPKSNPSRGLLKPLKNRTWLCLGKSLLKLYKFLYDCESETAFFSYINIKTVEDEKTSPTDSEVDVTSTRIKESIPTETEDLPCSKAETNMVEDGKPIKGEKQDDGDDNDDDDADMLTELVSVAPKLNETEKDSNEGGSKPKRRKCSPTLADQLKICDKRRSARNKTVLKNNEQSLSKTLKNLIPTSLRPEKDRISKSDNYDLVRWSEDSFDTMDIYRLLFEQQDQSNLPSHPVNQLSEQSRIKLLQDEAYFSTDKEMNDIDWYLKINNDQMILELIEAYLRELASKWNYTWPSKLANIFVEMYQILMKHGFEGKRIKLLENWNMKSEFDEESTKSLREKLELVLLYGELLLNQCYEDSSKEQPLGSSILGGNFSSLLLGDMNDACSVLHAPDENIELWMRSCWLEALLFLQKKDTFATCCALSMLVDEIPNPNIEVKLPNMKQFHLISAMGAKRLLNTLHRNQNLNEVKELFAENQYERVIEILQETLKPDSQQLMYLPNENTLTRYQQYNLLFAALWESKNYEELFKWCEVACYEGFAIYRKSFFDEVETEMKSKWASLVMNTLSGMLSCLKSVGPSLLDTVNPEHHSRLVQTLSNLVCHQIEATEPSAEITADVVTPWILLANLIDFNEKKEGINNSNDEIGEVCIFPSLSILFIAHEHLGKRNWCCFDDGALLYYTLNVVGPMFHRCVISSDVWMTLGQQVDQIFHCLYAHPYKRNRPRYVQDHGSLGLALTWNRALQAYLFYRPQKLPEFDAASKYDTITADTETLLKRIVPLVPEEQNPSRFMDSLHQFLNCSQDNIPENENKLQDEVYDLYYLLADYYFKAKIMGKAIKYYSLDVCSNPHRVDSWAAMALARGSQLEMKLNSCESISNESEILKKSALTDKCYKTALKLEYYQPSLWIEYAVFCYGIHAFCSRLLKQGTTNLSLETFDMVDKKKNKFLETSFASFNHANEAWLKMIATEEDLQDERWLNHYMLGKIAEKKEENIGVSLNHYFEAAKLLHRNGAEYPMKIVYSSPQYYSVEALELYYRVHASILKLLEAHEEKPLSRDTVESIRKYIKRMEGSPFARAKNSDKLAETANKISEKPKDVVTKDNDMKECFEVNNIDQDVKVVLKEIVAEVVKQTSCVVSIKRKIDGAAEDDDDSTCKRLKQETENNVVSEGSTSNITVGKGSSSIMEAMEESATAAVPKVVSEEQTRQKKSSLECSSGHSSSSAGSSSDSTSSKNSSSSSTESDGETDEESTKEGEQMRKQQSESRSSWEKERKCLAEKCIECLEECVRRFPEHYKSYYRLSHHFFRSKLDKDIEKARTLLFGERGLFSNRIMRNFFGGIWTNPSGEIERSGSFPFHMSRSVHLLIDILRDTNDYKTLLHLSIQLRYKPDLDKKYLRDNEREEISKEALSLSAQSLRRIITDVSLTETEENKRKLLMDVYKFYQRVVKHFSQKDAPFGKLLNAMYCKYSGRQDKVTTEQILAFCKSLNFNLKMGAPTLGITPPATAVFPIMEESDMSKALTHVINLSLNEPTAPLLNFAPSTHHQSVIQKACLPETKTSNFASIPSNLKNIPHSISVTTVQKPKISSQHLLGETSSLMFGLPKMIPTNRNQQGEIKLKSKLTPKQTKPASALKITKVKQFKAKGTGNRMTVKLPSSNNGLSITPVMKRTKTTPPLVVQPSSKVAPRAPQPTAAAVIKTKPVIVIPDILRVKKECSSLVITPVENKNQPTLQQKLAAKQFANTVKNTAGSSSSSKATSTSKPSASAAGKAGISFDKSRSLGASGVSIFPLPAEGNVSRFGGKEAHTAMQQFQHSVFLPPSVTQSVTAYPTQMSKSRPDKKSQAGLNKNNLMMGQPAKSKSHEDKLKHTLKALEENSGIIITPKLPKSNELEIILKDK